MKALRIIPLIVIVLILVCVIIYVLRNVKSRNVPVPKVYEGTLIEFNYSPGYSDEAGESHHESLCKNDAGEWIIKSRDREYFGKPMIVTTYEVSADDVLTFETFLKESGVLDLSTRPDGDEFMTDYSPWNVSISFDASATGGSKREYCSFSQYLDYSDADRALIKELKSRFKALHGKVISTKKEKDK